MTSERRKKENGLEKYESYEDAQKHLFSVSIYCQEPKTEFFKFISSIGGVFVFF